jgi:hypothetical protein
MVQHVSPRRTQNAYALLHRPLNEAVLEGLLLTDPAAGVRLPRTTRHTENPWTMEELKAVAHATGRYERVCPEVDRDDVP